MWWILLSEGLSEFTSNVLQTVFDYRANECSSWRPLLASEIRNILVGLESRSFVVVSFLAFELTLSADIEFLY